MSQAAAKIVVAALAAIVAAGPALAAPAPGACALLSKDEVKKFSSNPFFDRFPPEEEKAGNGSSCNYAGVMIQVDPFAFATVDNLRRQPEQVFEAAPGIGDAAYMHDNRGNYAELYARVGQRVFTIQMDIGPQETYQSVKPRLTGLANLLAAKLR